MGIWSSALGGALGSWQVALVCAVLTCATYLAIAGSILVPLTRSHQLRANLLGSATAAIFLTGAIHHGAAAVHLLLARLGIADAQGLATRGAWGWPLAAWDLLGVVVGLCYWSVRRHQGSWTQGAQLFIDLQQRQQQARELNDTVLQGLVVAKMALDLDQPVKADEALTGSIGSARAIIADLLDTQARALELLRGAPAAVVTRLPPPADLPTRVGLEWNPR